MEGDANAPGSWAGSPQNAARVLVRTRQLEHHGPLPAAGVACKGRAMATGGDPRQRRRDMIARNIRAMLREADRSAYWLARQIGVSDQQMSGYLNARHEPGPKRLQQIADVLGCTLGDLYRENAAAA